MAFAGFLIFFFEKLTSGKIFWLYVSPHKIKKPLGKYPRAL
jgi:hypothetical protein